MNIAVSILTSNYDEKETIERVNNTDASELHVDVMDGHFVPNRTFFDHLEKSKKKLYLDMLYLKMPSISLYTSSWRII